MCFPSNKPQEVVQPAAQPVPVPAQASASAPVDTESSIAAKKKQQNLAYQSGLASTIKTSGQGDTSSANLLASTATSGKKKLGE
jgi:hypothetical protein